MATDKTIQSGNGTGPGKQSMIRIYIAFVFIFFFALAIIFKAIHIQIFEGSDLKMEAESRELKYFPIEALRGNIYSANGNLLATSIPVFDIRMDTDSVLIPDSIFNAGVLGLAKGLSGLFKDKTATEYLQILQNARKLNKRYVKIQDNVTFEELDLLKRLPIFNRGKWAGGMIAEQKTFREYPYSTLARRTIGYSQEKSNVRVGIEGRFDQELKGSEGKQLKKRIADGDWRPVFDENIIEPKNGKDIITTIDTYLQDVSESSLRKHLRNHQALKGTLILMEVETGEIKAMANLQYDSVTDEFKEVYNIAIRESYEPGSTFKLVSTMMTIEDGALKKSGLIHVGNGSTFYHGREMKDSHTFDDDGWVTPEEAFVHSSNVGISRLVHDHYMGDNKKFYHQLAAMFPVDSVGMDIRGEATPGIKSPDSAYWSAVSIPWMAIGYGLTVTPIHLLTFYNAVANNGVMVRPRLIKEIKEAGVTVKKFEPEILIPSIASKSTIQLAQSYLEGVVDHGTGKNVKNPLYKIAGKTGTAKINKNGVYIRKYNASFAGYFPADNPKYSCIVVIFSPNAGAYYASQVAAPVFKEVADIIYSMELNIHPGENSQYVDMIAQRPHIDDPMTKIRENKINDSVFEGRTPHRFEDFVGLAIIPDVTGLGVNDAVYLLENLGLDVKISGQGLVSKQSLPAGTPVAEGNQILLTMEMQETTETKEMQESKESKEIQESDK